MGRLISAGALAYEQLDFFLPAGTSRRVTGILSSNIQMWMFVNNQILSWPLVDGSSVPDSDIAAGKVYFNEIAGSPGFYGLRFFPDRIGLFRMTFLNPSISIEVSKEFDVLPPGVLRPPSGGLIPSTTPSSRC